MEYLPSEYTEESLSSWSKMKAREDVKKN